MAKKKPARKSKTKKSSARSSKAKSPKKTKKTAAKKRVSKKTPSRKSRRPAAKKKTAPKMKKAATAARPAKASAATPRSTPVATARRPAAAPRPSAPVVLPKEEQVGRVTHYFSHLMVAVIELDKGSLGLGDKIHFKGHTTDFSQNVESIEIEHQAVMRAERGQSFGLKVRDMVREHDIVYRALS